MYVSLKEAFSAAKAHPFRFALAKKAKDRFFTKTVFFKVNNYLHCANSGVFSASFISFPSE